LASEPNKTTPRTKHIAVKYHFFCSHVGTDIRIHKANTEEQLADVFTKGLPAEKHKIIVAKLMGWDNDSSKLRDPEHVPDLMDDDEEHPSSQGTVRLRGSDKKQQVSSQNWEFPSVAVASGTQAMEEKLSTSYPTGILWTGRWATWVKRIDEVEKVDRHVMWSMFARLQTRLTSNKTGPS